VWRHLASGGRWAVNQSGEVLDILAQGQGDKRAVKRFFHKPLKALGYSLRSIGTDRLRSYAAVTTEVMPGPIARAAK
jgi:transposase-like protein